MRKIIAITIFSFIFFLAEFVVFNILGGQLKPNLLLILVVFINLYLGIRYSLLTAFLAGFVRDSFGVHAFGIAIVSLLFCAYMTTLIKRYLNFIGSGSSRILIVLLVSTLNIGVYFALSSIFYDLNFGQMILKLWFPEIVLTTIVSGYAFQILRKSLKSFGI